MEDEIRNQKKDKIFHTVLSNMDTTDSRRYCPPIRISVDFKCVRNNIEEEWIKTQASNVKYKF